MGKKGNLLRAQKAAVSTYTFTSEQLLAHDNQVRKEFLERKRSEWEAAIHDKITEDFNERQKLLEGSSADVTANIFSMLVSVPCRVLVRDFGWTPIFGNGHAERTKLARFMIAVREEADRLLTDELLDIRDYAKTVYDETGIMMEVEDN